MPGKHALKAHLILHYLLSAPYQNLLLAPRVLRWVLTCTSTWPRAETKTSSGISMQPHLKTCTHQKKQLHNLSCNLYFTRAYMLAGKCTQLYKRVHRVGLTRAECICLTAKKQLLFAFISIQTWNTRRFPQKLLTHTGAKEIFCNLQLRKGQSGLKALLHGAVVFLQQAHMLCPIFLSTIPPYIRPVISWVVTVRAQSANTVTSAAEGEQWGRKKMGAGEEERKTLPYFSLPERHEVSVWCEREVEKGSESGRWGWCKQELSRTEILGQLSKSVT